MDDAGVRCTDDAQCDDGLYCNGVELCQPGSATADANGCISDPSPRCLASQACDEDTRHCVTDCGINTDADGDGHDAVECRGDDCDDSDADRFPGNTEICDPMGHDEDCDPRTFGVRDQDDDGFPDENCCNTNDETGATICGTDCDDTIDSVKPGQVEICDLLDNDCDADVDEGARTTFFVDADGDGFGDESAPTLEACQAEEGYVANWTDCDDTVRARNPSATEICDQIDNDCDGRIDENVGTAYYPDADQDSFGDRQAEPTFGCAVAPSGMVPNALDCDDAAQGVNPAAFEFCDGVDNNCNGTADEGLTRLVYPDMDEDGHGDADGTPEVRCPGPGWANSNTDCDDNDRFTYPGAIELCDEKDNNCVGGIDEGTTDVPWYVDADGDGYGDVNSVPIASCSAIEGRSQFIDCDDTNGDTYPGAPQICDGIENNCSTGLGGSPRPSEDQDGDGHASLLASCDGGPYPKDDCDDAASDVYAGAPEPCNRIDNNCSTGGGEDLVEDADFDGHSPDDDRCEGGFPIDDCNDARADTYAGAPELCDGRDNNCDGTAADDPSEDSDGDGQSPMSSGCMGGPFPKTDCDDSRDDVYAGAPESCDRIDSDCSSGGGVATDEDVDDDGFAAADATCVGGMPRTDCDDTMAELAACAPPAARNLSDVQHLSDSSSPWRLGDADGDGDLDLPSHDYSTWQRNDGSGGFTTVSGGASSYNQIFFGIDIDGDGDGDTISRRGTTIRWGDDPTAEFVVTASAESDTTLKGVDVNGDGRGDILSGRQLYLNVGPDGDGVPQWERIDPFATAPHPRDDGQDEYAMTAHDIDGDGRNDLILHGNKWAQHLSWSRSLSADGRSWSTPEPLYDKDVDGPTSIRAFAFGDVDGDGRDELIFEVANHLNLLEINSSPGSRFASVTASSLLDTLLARDNPIRVLDVDQDGDVDIVATDTADRVWIYFENLTGDGTSWRRWEYSATAVSALGLDVGDIDGDGSNDFTWKSFDGGGHLVWLAGGPFGAIEPAGCTCWMPTATIPAN